MRSSGVQAGGTVDDVTAALLGTLAESVRRAESWITTCAYDVDRAAYVARGRTARSDRRVGLRPAPDTMSVLSGFLPVEQGVACLAALRAARRRGPRGR